MEVTAVTIAIGAVLIALGAVGATLTQRRLEEEGRGTAVPVWLLPFGVLVGAGAALIRGWDLVASIVAGAVLIPVVGIVGRLVELRRQRAGRGSARRRR